MQAVSQIRWVWVASRAALGATLSPTPQATVGRRSADPALRLQEVTDCLRPQPGAQGREGALGRWGWPRGLDI